MNIMVNALLLNKQLSGVQYSIENMLKEMPALINHNCSLKVIVARHYDGGLRSSGLDLLSPGINTVNRGYRVMWENTMLPFLMHRKKSRQFVYHAPGYILPPYSPPNSVVTVHDLIALQFPELCQDSTAMYFNLRLPSSIKRARRIIAVSKTVKQDIIQRFKISPEKIDVIYHGIHPHFKVVTDEIKLQACRRAHNLPGQYVLFVGNIEPKKNLPLIIKAIAELRRQGNLTHKLVIAGRPGWKYESVYSLIKKLDLNDEVLFLGYVPDADMPLIYNMADAFLFPSIYEGFGMPVLEAMACGVPVITSRGGALPEIAAGNSIEIESENVEQLTKAIYDLLNDAGMKRKYREAGLQHATNFSWRTCAQQTLQTYEQALTC